MKIYSVGIYFNRKSQFLFLIIERVTAVLIIHFLPSAQILVKVKPLNCIYIYILIINV